jgi:hypothetical protein
MSREVLATPRGLYAINSPSPGERDHAMQTITESTGTVNFDHTLTNTRAIWREAVTTVAERAKATLPQCNGRVDKAVALVLNGDVEILGDGTARVASQSNGQTIYHIVNGHCDCRDYEKAPEQWCKHRLAHAIAKRAYPLAKAKLNGTTGQALAPAAAPVETPAAIPPQHVVMIQGKAFVKFAGLLQMAHERGLVSLTATWTYNDSELSLAQAVATFQDGRHFEESGDATPSNTNRKVALHFRRVALTRAKARALRDALGVDLVAVEELADE